MADDPKPGEKQWFVDKTKLLDLVKELDAKTGFVYDPTATPQKVREMMLAQGIRPEDNIFSRDIIRHRYPDEEDYQMAVVQKPGERQWFSDKTRFFQMMEEIDRNAGIDFDPTMTGEKVQQMMLAHGIRPEENMLSREIIRAKYPDEGEGEE